MQEHHTGRRISKVGPSHLSENMFSLGDIVLSIDGYDVANDGTVPFRENERISFAYPMVKTTTGSFSNPTRLKSFCLLKK